jgi:hypothetical protein
MLLNITDYFLLADGAVLPLRFLSSGLRRCQIWPVMAKYNFQNSQKCSQNFLHKKWKSLIIALSLIKTSFFFETVIHYF